MIDAQKQCHKIYSLVRKRESFERLKNFYYNSDLYQYMKEIILSHNTNKLSLFVQTMNKYILIIMIVQI